MKEIFLESIDRTQHVIATYSMEGTQPLDQQAIAVALGQSIGNPHMRNSFENSALIENYSCKILHTQKSLATKNAGDVQIAFPLRNFNFDDDGVAHILCQLLGGQTDIAYITKCHLKKVDFPEQGFSLKPRFGISGIRTHTQVAQGPLLGGIIKPKIGLNLKDYLTVISEMVDGGINFIKEDEIMSNQAFLPLEPRVKAVSALLKNSPVVFAYSLTSNPFTLEQRLEDVVNWGGHAVHVNVWSGLGIYQSIRSKNLPLFLFFQKSGEKVFTHSQNPFSMAPQVLFQLAARSGVDFAQVGMLGGYGNDAPEDVIECVKILNNNQIIPSLSCGAHPGLVDSLRGTFGENIMISAGGAIHGHPMGTKSGVRAFIQAIHHQEGEELETAISLWGKS